MLVDGRITTHEFEIVFFRFFAEDTTAWPPDVFNVLETFFFALDDFVADPELRAEVHGIDEDQLLLSAQVALDRLASFAL